MTLYTNIIESDRKSKNKLSGAKKVNKLSGAKKVYFNAIHVV